MQGRSLEPGSSKGRAADRAPPRRAANAHVAESDLEAMRALSYVTSASMDFALRHPDERVRKEHRALVEFMTPIVKGWCTESAIDLCSDALQIFGGMGYVEETGIAQYYRDVRITTIYEGTTGIQSLDLLGRKLLRDMGATATTFGGRMAQTARECAASKNADVRVAGTALGDCAAVARRDIAMVGHDGARRFQPRVGVQRAVSQDVGSHRGRLADGARRSDCRCALVRVKCGQRIL